jgi:tRNA A-37 threonylcarbamoyl transferase component Bud32
MAGSPVSDPIRDVARRLASSWQESYLMRADPSWWYFDPITGRAKPQQGWKLHVSAVPVTALKTVRGVADVVMPRGVRWKVARSVTHLIRLGSPPSPVPQVGKFITVYPDGDVNELAEELHEVTKFFDAPVVPSDRRYRRGSNVYLRFGAFAGMSSYRGPDQTSKWLIADPAGNRAEDRRRPGEYAPPWVGAPPVPAEPPAPARPGAGLFGRGLTALNVLNQSAKGGVYRCLWRDRPVVLKEARIGTCPDVLGRDARARLLNEWHVLHRLSGTGLAPEPLDFFYAEDNAYLIEEHLPGTTLRERVEEINYCGPFGPGPLTSMWHSVADLTARVRANGVRLHDLTANNIMVSDDRYSIIDLEHSALAGSAEPRFDGWTPGYVPPGGNTDDDDPAYALAAIGHLIFTGLVPYADPEEPFGPHVDAVLREFGPAPAGPAATAIAQVRRVLSSGRSATPAHPASTAAQQADRIIAEAVTAGQELVRRVEWDRRPWPWPDQWSGGSVHPASFMTGTAGIVQFYLDLWRATDDRCWVRHADELLEWTHDVFPFVPGESPPGLYFGLSSLPWLMADVATASEGVRAARWLHRATELSAAITSADVGAWDVTHGWAGIGIGELAMLRATGADAHRVAAGAIMRRILDGAGDEAGLPVWRTGDRTYYGFGHGSAGIAYFLLHAGRMLDAPGAVELAVATGHRLLDIGTTVADGRGLTWRHTPTSGTAPWTHWCNGAAGVGLFLLSLWSRTRDAAFLEASVRAGRAISLSRAFASCCRCHGLAGDADFLLELAGQLDDGEEFRVAAERTGRKLDALKMQRGFAPKWPHEGDGSPRPGYMRGYTGVHAFRLRLAGRPAQTPLMLPTSTVRSEGENR